MNLPAHPPSSQQRSRRALVVAALLFIAAAVAAQWWHMRRSERFGAQLAALARPGDILLIAGHDCDECAAARAWLRQYRIHFTECSIDDDAHCAAEFRAAQRGSSGKPWPPVMIVRGELQAGFAPTRIYERLRSTA